MIASATRYAHIDVRVVTQRRCRDRDLVTRLKWRNVVPRDGRLRDPCERGHEHGGEHNKA